MSSHPARLVTAVLALVLLAALPAGAEDVPFLPEGDPTFGAVTRFTDGAGTGWETNPAVAGSTANGRFLVVWSDRRDGENDIYAQKVRADGSRIGTNFAVSPAVSQNGESEPAVVWNPVKNQFLVVWADDREWMSRGRDIWAQRVLPDGTLEGGPIQISGAGAIENDMSPDVAVDPVSGRYLVVWRDDRDKTSRGSDIYGQLLNKHGWLVKDNFRVSDSAALGEEYYPSVGADPAGTGFLVAWRDDRVPGGSSIMTQRVKATGKRPGGNVDISGGNAAWPSHPDVSGGAAGAGYLVVWSDTRPGEVLEDVLGRRIGANGLPKTSRFLVSGTDAVRVDEHAVSAWDESRGRWMVVWWEHEIVACDTAECTPPPADPAQVFGRRVKPSGKRAGARFLIATATNEYTTLDPAVAWSTPAGRHLAVWTDDWNSSSRGADTYGVTLHD
jgi:hypothetical protein